MSEASSEDRFFSGFSAQHVALSGATLWCRSGGAGGLPLLLLHGHPRTHATWHAVAARLQGDFQVICPDLRGYGRSSKPPTDAEHAPYSKRAMARDMAELMTSRGHRRFVVAGHDRGAYVALRLALDHPELVCGLVILEAVPISEALGRCDARFAQRWWHWFFFAQPDKPEAAINADPNAWYGAPERKRQRMGDEAFEDYQRAIHDPATVSAMLEDYRAGLGVDREHELADVRAGRQVACPMLLGWASGDDLGELYGKPAAVWARWCAHPVQEVVFDCGHHIAEERAPELAQAIAAFAARCAGLGATS